MEEKPKLEGGDRRDRYRLTREIKVLVKVGSQFSHVGSIKNMSRTGMFFEAFGDYRPGMGLEVTFPYDPSKQSSGEKPQSAEVVRVQEIEGSMKKGVAVKLLHLFLKP